MNGRHLTKIALRVLIGAVAVSAVLGIYALLRRDVDEWSARTLGTTLFVSAASLLIMANAAGLERRSAGYLLISGGGLFAALVALPIFLYALWLDVDDDGLWRSAASLEAVSVFAGHSSLLSLRRLSVRYRWLMPAATLLGGALAALIIWMMWADDSESDKWRAAGVLAILLLSVTIIIPMLSRLVALDERENGQGRLSYGVRYCPSCGQALRASSARARCTECGARFAVEFDKRH